MTAEEIIIASVVTVLLLIAFVGVLSPSSKFSKEDLVNLQKENKRREDHLAFIQHSTREIVRLAQAKLNALEAGDQVLYQSLCLERDYLEVEYNRKCNEYDRGL